MAETVPPGYGTLERLRDEAVEQLHLCAFHSSLAVDQGLVAADAGLVYNTRRAVAHLRMATDVLRLMHEHRQRDRARHAAREGAAVVLGLDEPGMPQ